MRTSILWLCLVLGLGLISTANAQTLKPGDGLSISVMQDS